MKKAGLVKNGRTSVRGQIVGDLVDVTWRMLVPTLIGLLAGYGVDSLAGTKPAGFLVGAVIGFAAGIYMAIRLLNQVNQGAQK